MLHVVELFPNKNLEFLSVDRFKQFTRRLGAL